MDPILLVVLLIKVLQIQYDPALALLLLTLALSQ